MLTKKINIDKDKCKLCGNCVNVCVSKALEIENEILIFKNQHACIMCGHCAAICNENAIIADTNDRKSFNALPIKSEYNEIEKILALKRSVREFKNVEIDKTIIEKLIYFAEKAPSSSNKRRREYIVITDKNKIIELEKAVIQKFNSFKLIINPIIINLLKLLNKKLAKQFALLSETIKKMNIDFEKKEYHIFRNAPCIVCICAPKKDIQAIDDCIISQQYMMLHAHSKDIGSCIIGYAQYAHKSIEKVLKIKKGYSIMAVSVFGYQKYKYKQEIEYTNLPEIKWF